MTGFPILDRELIVRCRSRRMTFWRIALTAGGTVAVMGMLQAGAILGWNPGRLGEFLFQVLSLLGIAYCLLAGPVLTADCLSGEKRQGTLQLLFLSSLPPSNVVLGKLVACSVSAVYALFAFLPMLALPFFLGGITLGEFWRTAGLLVALLTLSLAGCGVISALSWSGRKALAGSAAALSIWCGLPWAWNVAGSTMPLADWYPDPLNFWLAAQHEGFAADAAPYRLRMMGSGFAFIGFVALAVLATPRFLDRPLRKPEAYQSWFRRNRSPEYLRERERWYALNPVAWVARQRSPRHVPILVFAAAFGATGVAALLSGAWFVRRPEIFMAFVFSLHGLLKLWLAWELSRCLSRDQAEGLLEPLLAAPLTEHQIVHGWIAGLQPVFRWPVLSLLAMDFAIWTGCDLDEWRYPLIAMMGTVVFDAYTLLWSGLYFGLIARTATRGLLHTIAAVLVVPWLAGLGFLAFLGFAGVSWLLPTSLFFLCIGWVAVGLLVDSALCFHCAGRLAGSFRNLVAEKT